jgi:KaiC/GvpD/RAD55 family RecA-like ATPase
MQNQHLENIWFRSVIENPSYLETTQSDFFKSKDYQETFKVVKSFWKKYNQIPSKNQVRESAKILKLEEQITDSLLEAMWKIDLNDYDKDWLESNTQAWIEWKTLEKSAVDSINYIRGTEVTPDNIKDVINTYKSIVVDRNKIDFSFDMGLNFRDPESHKQYSNLTFSSGYDYIDYCLGGGFSAKCLYVFLGQPKVGKTLWLGNIATQAIRASNHVAIITLELSDRKYMKRLGSNLLGIKMSEYKESADNDEMIKKKVTNLAFENLRTPGELVVKEFPTSQASAIDVENWLTKVEQILGIKFKIVIIDYINIMKNWRNPNSENTYMKIKQIAEDLRAAAQRNEWAIVTATQTKQSEFDATDLSMNSASESSGLVATVDGMFGIIQDPLMYSNNEYKLKLLANRDEGYKNSYKKFIVDYPHMRIMEDPNSEIGNEQ